MWCHGIQEVLGMGVKEHGTFDIWLSPELDGKGQVNGKGTEDFKVKKDGLMVDAGRRDDIKIVR